MPAEAASAAAGPEGRALVPVGDADLARCHALLKAGSKSFHAASFLLPPALRAPVASLYAFCRVADDEVDESPDGPAAGLLRLRGRLDRIYAGTPDDDPVDRAFAQVVQRYQIPRRVPELLFEGFEWDAVGHRYRAADDTVAYGVRVASTVGVMMTLIMGPRDRATLARAADLGVAMQLTNIARDVGEDAKVHRRVYLPEAWLEEAGTSAEGLLAEPQFTPAVGGLVQRLLAEADTYYQRANTGIGRLPWRCRFAIRAALLIYRDIGRVIAKNGHDSMSQRAYTSLPRKLWLLSKALFVGFWTPKLDRSPPPAPVAVLVDTVES